MKHVGGMGWVSAEVAESAVELRDEDGAGRERLESIDG